MNILVAPNAFKNSLTAPEVAKAISTGISISGLKANIVSLPLADGGDGSLDVMVNALEGKIVRTRASDPLGRRIDARWGWIPRKGMAIVELAEASGIRHLRPSELNPLIASTAGTGQLLNEAIDKGAELIYLGVGGSATVDGGLGILSVLGLKCLDGEGREIRKLVPETWAVTQTVDLQSLNNRMGRVPIIVLADVTNPLIGMDGAARVFGPQKGASTSMIEDLEKFLTCMSALVREIHGRDVSTRPGGGAAGGVVAGLDGFLNAEIRPGALEIMKTTGFFDHLERADLIITGEGAIDQQTILGKVPGIVAMEAEKRKIPVIGICGTSSLDDYYPFSQIIQVADPGKSLEQNIADSYIQIEGASAILGKSLEH